MSKTNNDKLHNSTIESPFTLNGSLSLNARVCSQNSLNNLDTKEVGACKTSKHNFTSDDLDEYASNNESTFIRRSNVRHSRKPLALSFNHHHQQHRSSLNNGSVLSLSGVRANNPPSHSSHESKFLFGFLNDGFEQNRELPNPLQSTSSNRNGIVINVTNDLDDSFNSSLSIAENKQTISLNDAGKRHSSLENTIEKSYYLNKSYTIEANTNIGK